jgi:protein gp37
MGDTTGIDWCDSTINLWIGCTKVSPACDNCYAEKLGRRFGVEWGGALKPTTEASWGKIEIYQRAAPKFRKEHRRDRRVFINSLSDFFDNQAEQAWRDDACRRMEAAPDVVFILVTKRPQNVARFIPKHWLDAGGWPANVWLLVTAENQTEYDRRVAHLLALRGPRQRGISMEPMLENIDPGYSLSRSPHERAQWAARYTRKVVQPGDVGALTWVIIGGESGHGARPMPPVDQLRRVAQIFFISGVAVFVKQMSAADFGRDHKNPAVFPGGLQRRDHPA